MLAVVCSRCRHRLHAWPVPYCPACGLDPHASPPDEDEEPPEDDDPTDEWEVGTGADTQMPSEER